MPTAVLARPGHGVLRVRAACAVPAGHVVPALHRQHHLAHAAAHRLGRRGRGTSTCTPERPSRTSGRSARAGSSPATPRSAGSARQTGRTCSGTRPGSPPGPAHPPATTRRWWSRRRTRSRRPRPGSTPASSMALRMARMAHAPMLFCGSPSQRRSVGECPTPTAATWPRWGHTPGLSAVRNNHGGRGVNGRSRHAPCPFTRAGPARGQGVPRSGPGPFPPSSSGARTALSRRARRPSGPGHGVQRGRTRQLRPGQAPESAMARLAGAPKGAGPLPDGLPAGRG